MARETTYDNGTLSYCSSSNGSFTAFDTLVDIVPNKILSNDVDTTNLNSNAKKS